MPDDLPTGCATHTGRVRDRRATGERATHGARRNLTSADIVEAPCADARTRQAGLTPAAAKLLEALRSIAPATNTQLVDWVAKKYGHGLTRETVSRSMSLLVEFGHARSDGEIVPFKPTTWLLAEGNHASM